MLDVRLPMGILFVTLGALLFFYGMFFSEAVPFYTPNSWFPLKLNMPVGAFTFVFGLITLTLARFVRIQTADRELASRERELDKIERRRQKALMKRAMAVDGPVQLSDDETEGVEESSTQESDAKTKGSDEAR